MRSESFDVRVGRIIEEIVEEMEGLLRKKGSHESAAAWREEILQEVERVRAKLTTLKRLAKTGEMGGTLRGILKGLEITEEDIEEAKRSLFKRAYDE